MAGQRQVLGKYELLGCIGRGGMAEIYLARQVGIYGFEKLLVVKTILPHLTESPEAQAFTYMFLDEARLAAQLNHPNIVQIYDLGDTDGRYYIAMEYVHGVDLGRLIQRTNVLGVPVPLEHAVKILTFICEALDYAHNRRDREGRPLGVIHRDVSPANVLVSLDGGVKLTDFGVAKARDRITETRIGDLKGKLTYMSPEQAGGRKIDHRADIFTAGLLLGELCTGCHIFEGLNRVGVVQQLLGSAPISTQRWRADLPSTLIAIVERALAKDPADRFDNALEMQMALDRFLFEHELFSSAAHIGRYVRDLFEQIVDAEINLLLGRGDPPRGTTGHRLRLSENPLEESLADLPTIRQPCPAALDDHGGGTPAISHDSVEDDHQPVEADGGGGGWGEIPATIEGLVPDDDEEQLHTVKQTRPAFLLSTVDDPVTEVGNPFAPVQSDVSNEFGQLPSTVHQRKGGGVEQEVDCDLQTFAQTVVDPRVLREAVVAAVERGAPGTAPSTSSSPSSGSHAILPPPEPSPDPASALPPPPPQSTSTAPQTNDAVVRVRESLAEFHLGTKGLLACEFKTAREHFSRAVALNDALAPAHRGLGIAHAKLGSFSAAVKAYGRFLELDPDGDGAARARLILEQMRKRIDLSSSMPDSTVR